MSATSPGSATGQPAIPAAVAVRPSPPWWQKVLRVFFFAFLGTFLTTVLPIAEKIASGEDVSFDFAKALLVSAIAAGIGAGIRALIALLPVFKDDNDIGAKKE
jgi:hypothetical protein